MYAVIESGGKQYRVAEGQTIAIEKLNLEVGGRVDFDRVLLIAKDEDIRVGKPYVADSKVSADVISQDRAKKIEIIKFKRRKHHMKSMGHRQPFTTVKITKIEG